MPKLLCLRRSWGEGIEFDAFIHVFIYGWAHGPIRFDFTTLEFAGDKFSTAHTAPSPFFSFLLLSSTEELVVRRRRRRRRRNPALAINRKYRSLIEPFYRPCFHFRFDDSLYFEVDR